MMVNLSTSKDWVWYIKTPCINAGLFFVGCTLSLIGLKGDRHMASLRDKMYLNSMDGRDFNTIVKKLSNELRKVNS